MDETLLEKFRYVKQDRFAPLAVMKKTNSENIMGGNKTKEGETDTGNMVGVAEVSVPSDVFLGRPLVKFQDLANAITNPRTVPACEWNGGTGKWACGRV